MSTARCVERCAPIWRDDYYEVIGMVSSEATASNILSNFWIAVGLGLVIEFDELLNVRD